MLAAVSEAGQTSGAREAQRDAEEEARKKTYMALMSEKPGPVITFNCGGEVHQVYEETLQRSPGTLLADLVKDPDLRAAFPKDAEGRFFIDRHPQAFYDILNYYRTGILIMPPTMMSLAWESELRFYRISIVKQEDDDSSEDIFKPSEKQSLACLVKFPHHLQVV